MNTNQAQNIAIQIFNNLFIIENYMVNIHIID